MLVGDKDFSIKQQASTFTTTSSMAHGSVPFISNKSMQIFVYLYICVYVFVYMINSNVLWKELRRDEMMLILGRILIEFARHALITKAPANANWFPPGTKE